MSVLAPDGWGRYGLARFVVMTTRSCQAPRGSRWDTAAKNLSRAAWPVAGNSVNKGLPAMNIEKQSASEAPPKRAIWKP